jgi:hypothetical protein
MASPMQNQAQAGPAVNVLHDQNLPNTLAGIGPPSTASRLHLPVGIFVVAVALIAAFLVILVGRLA